MMERAESCQKLYTRLRFWEFPDEYVIEPTDDAIPECSAVRGPKIQAIFGVVGMLKLVAGSYLIVITEHECVVSYLGHLIFKVVSMRILPCDHSLKNSSPEQKKVESEFSGLLKVAEMTVGLFFSYGTNLTLSAQRLNDLGHESKLLPLWRQEEPRFLWNSYMLEVLIDHKLDPFLLPVFQGSFQNFQAAFGKEIVDVTLIARRCTRRNGTRMWRRGADPDEYVANFVETEQIVQMNGFIASFVQPRVTERHFLDLRKKYGVVLAIELVNTVSIG
ncbi:Phosphoinositide phosphatase SAC7 [Hibiscus syriacus]|uniref:Phosphoinositide phosphatase SAC7 n=1 Tax=Hibiscus syriacus TaxID=106335 RepID=A0A6A2X808_HIBSY|nr:Phosphoinositide phosphatase SAC7 [Hibiscus syriacus]